VLALSAIKRRVEPGRKASAGSQPESDIPSRTARKLSTASIVRNIECKAGLSIVLCIVK
jgi:hypothetical protein